MSRKLEQIYEFPCEAVTYRCESIKSFDLKKDETELVFKILDFEFHYLFTVDFLEYLYEIKIITTDGKVMYHYLEYKSGYIDMIVKKQTLSDYEFEEERGVYSSYKIVNGDVEFLIEPLVKAKIIRTSPNQRYSFHSKLI